MGAGVGARVGGVVGEGEGVRVVAVSAVTVGVSLSVRSVADGLGSCPVTWPLSPPPLKSNALARMPTTNRVIANTATMTHAVGMVSGSRMRRMLSHTVSRHEASEE